MINLTNNIKYDILYIEKKIKEEYFMETKKYICPVCGRRYGVDELDKLSLCISKHNEDIATEKEKEKTKNIERLKRDNLELVSKINENCKELQKLGIVANVHYSQTNSNGATIRNDKTLNDYKSTEDFLKDFTSIFEKEIEKERAKLTPEERQTEDNFEKQLRTILGLY